MMGIGIMGMRNGNRNLAGNGEWGTGRAGLDCTGLGLIRLDWVRLGRSGQGLSFARRCGAGLGGNCLGMTGLDWAGLGGYGQALAGWVGLSGPGWAWTEQA